MLDMNTPRTCGYCRYHKYDSYGQDWFCENEESEYNQCYTGFEDACDEWEEKEE